MTVYPPAKTIVFRNDDGTGAIETNYSYLWHTGTVETLQRTTTLPSVPADQNGSASSTTRVDRFDESGNLVWTRDERGFISYMEYDPATGSVTRRIDDVDGSQLTLPSGWSTPAGGGLHLVSDYEHDGLGRTTQVLGPPHDVDGTSVRTAAWTVYSDDGREVRTAQGAMTETSGLDLDTLTVDEWDAMTVDQWDALSVDRWGVIGSATSPVTITKFDDAGRAVEMIQAPRTAGGQRLSMTETYAQSTYSRWTVHSYEDDLLVSTRVYHAIPTSASGSAGTNYNETTYAFDSMERQNRVKSPGGTITRTVFDVRSNPVNFPKKIAFFRVELCGVNASCFLAACPPKGERHVFTVSQSAIAGYRAVGPAGQVIPRPCRRSHVHRRPTPRPRLARIGKRHPLRLAA